MKYHKRERVIYDDDDNELVWCSQHQDYLIHTEFDLSEKTDTGYMTICKGCRILHQEKYKDSGKVRKDIEMELSNLLLKNIGYEINGEFTIHEQFLIKHQEKINEKKVVRTKNNP